MKITPESIPLPNADQDRPLWFLQDRLREILALGELTTCTCCGQPAKVYSRRFSELMARMLRAIVQSNDGLTTRALIVRANTAGSGDYAKLVHWGLVGKIDDRWVATQAGRDFANGRTHIPSRVLLYNNICLGFDQREYVHIAQFGSRVFELEYDAMSADAVREAVVSS